MIKSVIFSFAITSSAFAKQWVPYDFGTTTPNVEAHYTYTTDSDKFNTNTLLVGGFSNNGIGAFVGESSYTAKNFSNHSKFAQLCYKKDNLYGKIGVRNINNENVLMGDIEYRHHIEKNLSVGVNVVSDNVDSINGINNNVKFIFTGVDIDYQPIEHVSVAFVVGNTYYSDGNNRQVGRTRVSYVVLPEYWISTYYKGKIQKDTSPGGKNYYSPSELYENSIGISMRERIGNYVVFASVDSGIQDATLNDNSKSNVPIHTYNLSVQTPVTKKDGVTYGGTIIKTNSGNSYSSSDGYSWTGINMWMKIPF